MLSRQMSVDEVADFLDSYIHQPTAPKVRPPVPVPAAKPPFDSIVMMVTTNTCRTCGHTVYYPSYLAATRPIPAGREFVQLTEPMVAALSHLPRFVEKSSSFSHWCPNCFGGLPSA